MQHDLYITADKPRASRVRAKWEEVETTLLMIKDERFSSIDDIAKAIGRSNGFVCHLLESYNDKLSARAVFENVRAGYIDLNDLIETVRQQRMRIRKSKLEKRVEKIEDLLRSQGYGIHLD